MMNEDEYVEGADIELGEALLKQLFHLKQYETPDPARMTRNRQNIMRSVREVSQSQRKSLSDLIEINFPWFFAEPRYGVAMLFVAFAGLQFLGVNARHAAQSDTGIYTTSTDRIAAFQQAAAASTNTVEYPRLPGGSRLFQDWSESDTLTPVGNPSPNWQK
jgi:hypothetical protein